MAPMSSIELILDQRSDAAIRADWAALEQAGLPNLSRHTGASNRPHVSLAVGPSLTDSPGLRAELGVLPIDAGLRSLVVFGSPPRGLVLARLVGVSRQLLDLHHRVHALSPTALEHSRAWTPHVTLGSRLTPEQLGLALPLLGMVLDVTFVGARLWDPASGTVTDLAG